MQCNDIAFVDDKNNIVWITLVNQIAYYVGIIEYFNMVVDNVDNYCLLVDKFMIEV